MTEVFTFVGVSTGASAIQRIYPRWCAELGIDGFLRGIDVPLGAPPAVYRDIVQRIRDEPSAVGGLVTTHKLNLLAASADLFDGLDESAALLHEVSCLHKHDGHLLGAALDDRTSALAIDRFAPASHWASTDAELLLLGAGGASIATTLGLHRAQQRGDAVPSLLHVTARSDARLQEMRELHETIGFRVPVAYHVTTQAAEADAVVRALPDASVVVNATGLGKDRPGSPLTDDVVFPREAIAWDMNYRGERPFLSQAAAAGARTVDGWDYFVYSWTMVVGVVHGIDIPSSGPVFDRLSAIARAAQPPVPAAG